MAEKLLNWR